MSEKVMENKHEMFTDDNRVNPVFIEAELGACTLNVERSGESTLIVAVAFDRDGFMLGVGTSKSIDPKNHGEAVGQRIAIENTMAVAKNKLWELYGFLLHKKMISEGLL